LRPSSSGASAEAHAKSETKGGVSEYDRHFVEETASVGMLEVELGKMASGEESRART
jgi:hypothetical protein